MEPLVAMISYQSQDIAAAELLHEELALRGFVVVHDQCSFLSGRRIALEMGSGVDRCDVFIAYLTPNSLYLDASPGLPRPAVDDEFLPAMQRRRDQGKSSRSGSAVTAEVRPIVVIPLTHGLGDPRREAPEVVRRATGEDISSLWSPAIDQSAATLTQADAARVACEALRSVLTAGTGSSDQVIPITVATRGGGQAPQGVSVDATMILGGEDRRPGAAADWNRYLAGIRDVERTLAAYTTERRLQLNAKAHLTGAIALGRVFNQVTGWRLEVAGRHGSLSPTDATDHPDLRVFWDQGSAGSKAITVEVDLLGHPVTSMATELIRVLETPPAGRLQITRTTAGELSPSDIASMAAAAASHIRDIVSRERPARIHLMCAAPVEFTVLLGHRMTALEADIQLYERDGAAYFPSLLLSATIP